MDRVEAINELVEKYKFCIPDAKKIVDGEWNKKCV